MYSHDSKSYSKLKSIFSNTLEKHAPLKLKTIKGNQVLFTAKNLSKATMNNSRLRKKHLKWPSRKYYFSYKKVKSKLNSLNKKAKKSYFQEATKNGVMNNRIFWNTVKPRTVCFFYDK